MGEPIDMPRWIAEEFRAMNAQLIPISNFQISPSPLNHHSPGTFQIHDPTLHQPPPHFSFQPIHPPSDLPPLFPPFTTTPTQSTTPYYPPMYPSNYYPEPPIEPNAYYSPNAYYQHTYPNLSHNPTEPYYSPPKSPEPMFYHQHTYPSYYSEHPIEAQTPPYHVHQAPSPPSFQSPPIIAFDPIQADCCRNWEARYVFDEMPQRGVDSCGEHPVPEKTEVLQEGEDEFEQTISEIHSPVATVEYSSAITAVLTDKRSTMSSNEECDEQIEKYEGSLEQFVEDYLKFGFNREENGVVYREWAPAAQEAKVIGEESPTGGTASIFGTDICSNSKAACRQIGYCPQFDALLEYLTIQEHLELYARIKGVPEYKMEDVASEKLVEFDLLKHADKPSFSLSRGNKRKLSVAIAMIGDPLIVILGEPPTAQALCTRMRIMVGGRLRYIGSSQHLKTRFGNHLELEIKPTEVSSLDLENFCRIIQEKIFHIPYQSRGIPSDLEIYAPPRIHPDYIFLVPGASYVFTVKEGPRIPRIGVSIEYSGLDDGIATVHKYFGLLSGITPGSTTIVAKVYGNGDIVICQAYGRVEVGIPSSVTLNAQSEQIGREMPIYPSLSEEDLFSVYEVCGNYKWTIEDEEVLSFHDIECLHSDKFAMEVAMFESTHVRVMLAPKYKTQRVQNAHALSDSNGVIERGADILEALMQLTQAPSWSWWIVMKASFFKRQQNSFINYSAKWKGVPRGYAILVKSWEIQSLSLRTSLILRGMEC